MIFGNTSLGRLRRRGYTTSDEADQLYIRIRGVRSSGRPDAAAEIMQILEKAWRAEESVSYAAFAEALLCCALQGRVENIMTILNDIKASGIETDSTVLDATLLGLYKAENYSEVVELLDYTRKRNNVSQQSFGLAMLARAHVGDLDTTVTLMKQMLADVKARRRVAVAADMQNKSTEVHSAPSQSSSGSEKTNSVDENARDDAPTDAQYNHEGLRDSVKPSAVPLLGEQEGLEDNDEATELARAIETNLTRTADTSQRSTVEVVNEKILVQTLRKLKQQGYTLKAVQFFSEVYAAMADLRQAEMAPKHPDTPPPQDHTAHASDNIRQSSGDIGQVHDGTEHAYEPHAPMASDVYAEALSVCAENAGYGDVAENVLSAMRQSIVAGQSLDRHGQYKVALRYGITSLMRDEQLDQVLELIDSLTLDEQQLLDNDIYTRVIRACDASGRVLDASSVHFQYKQLQTSVTPDATRPGLAAAAMYWYRGEYTNAARIIEDTLKPFAEGQITLDADILFQRSELDATKAYSLLHYLLLASDQKLDVTAFEYVVDAMSRANNWKGALAVFQEMARPNAPLPTMQTVHSVAEVCLRARRLANSGILIYEADKQDDSAGVEINDGKEQLNDGESGEGSGVHNTEGTEGVDLRGVNDVEHSTVVNPSTVAQVEDPDLYVSAKQATIRGETDTAEQISIASRIAEAGYTIVSPDSRAEEGQESSHAKPARLTNDHPGKTLARVDAAIPETQKGSDSGMESARDGRSTSDEDEGDTDDDELDELQGVVSAFGTAPKQMSGFVTTMRYKQLTIAQRRAREARVKSHPMIKYVEGKAGLSVADEREMLRMADSILANMRL